MGSNELCFSFYTLHKPISVWRNMATAVFVLGSSYHYRYTQGLLSVEWLMTYLVSSSFSFSLPEQ